MAEESGQHGGRLLARALRAAGVRTLFTLSGGHLFSLYDGCREEGIALVDTRHEQSAAFAAEGWAKVTREIGVCALTAGPGVTNGMSAIASAAMNHSPMLVLGGRAPEFRWGQGSLQELDHVPLIAPLARLARTARATGEIPELIGAALAAAAGPHGGPAFVDLPLDVVFGSASGPAWFPVAPRPWEAAGADSGALADAAAALRGAERPVIMAGTDLYWGRGEQALRALAEAHSIPVFQNGLARGCVPADHPLAFSRARSTGLREADVVLVIGVPLDFRLGFGGVFGDAATVIGIDTAAPDHAPPRALQHTLIGGLDATLRALADAAAPVALEQRAAREDWVAALRGLEDERRGAEAAELSDARAPLHPMRIYGELASMLDRDAIIIGDGGDFVSYAGRVVDSLAPGCWVDPGPYGCLGSGPGYALAAKLAHPDRQVVLLLGDGAFGFSGMEFDTLARHGVAVVAIVGNNGIWGLEKHPMEAMYGYSVVADLRPGTRYDEVAEALGCHGELVRAPGELRPALERAFAAGRPALVNVLTDPAVAYPRRSNLA
ncbi:MAG TPA: acetolactate synthase [Solirubrobacteraceae bacterium]|nr:acetolactate synthase [Solirubrobacteraceae bacterium]